MSTNTVNKERFHCEFCADDRDLESYGVIYLIDCSILDTHIQQKERTAFKFLLRQSLVEE